MFAIPLIDLLPGTLSEIAFHKKVGWSEVDFFAGWNIIFLLSSGPVAMLPSALSKSDFSLQKDSLLPPTRTGQDSSNDFLAARN
jgi:hypothetical protein